MFFLFKYKPDKYPSLPVENLKSDKITNHFIGLFLHRDWYNGRRNVDIPPKGWRHNHDNKVQISGRPSAGGAGKKRGAQRL